MSVVKWSPVVYGRTFKSDFRFLAVPRWYSDDDRLNTYSLILTTTALPERLAGGPIWVLHQRGRLRLFGVTCMAAELLGPEASARQTYLRDSAGRGVYLFAGYAADLSAGSGGEVPRFPVGLELFRPLYEFVAGQWEQEGNQPARLTVEQGLDYQPAAGSRSGPQVNERPDELTLWPDTEETRAALWESAAALMSAGRETSLCLGLARRREAQQGPFTNATVKDVDARITVPRQYTEASHHHADPARENAYTDTRRRTDHAKADDAAPAEESGGLSFTLPDGVGLGVGLTLGFKLYGLPGALGGALCGLLTAGALAEEGIGRDVVTRVQKLVSRVLPETRKTRDGQRTGDSRARRPDAPPHAAGEQQQQAARKRASERESSDDFD